jgi:hypothetical protein
VARLVAADESEKKGKRAVAQARQIRHVRLHIGVHDAAFPLTLRLFRVAPARPMKK